MKRHKFTEAQILQVLKQYEGGREALDCMTSKERRLLVASVSVDLR